MGLLARTWNLLGASTWTTARKGLPFPRVDLARASVSSSSSPKGTTMMSSRSSSDWIWRGSLSGRRITAEFTRTSASSRSGR